jgi:dihydrofolate reductase
VAKKQKRVKMPWATSIVARSYPDMIIGIENALPWHLGTDLRLFKRRTEGHAIIMGRKTFESIGRPLPRRLNIVLSRQPFQESTSVKWAKDPETALLMADIFSICHLKKQFFVIGGEKIYDTFFEFIDKVYLTDVFCGNINGDAKFPYEFSQEDWVTKDEVEYRKTEIDDHPFRITCYRRRVPKYRYKTKEKLLRSDPDVASFLDRYEQIIEDLDDDDDRVDIHRDQMRLFD